MGGGAHYDYPKFVWSPAGGWWANPKAWKANTVAAAVATAVICIPAFIFSSNRERRPIPPHRHIPSQSWCKHAKEDDPSLVSGAKSH